MENIKKYILGQVAGQKLPKADAAKMLKELMGQSSANENIAIIGMDGRYPMADSVEEYWDNLCDGKLCIDRFPDLRREDTDLFLKKNVNGEDPYQQQGYIREIDKFDPVFFGITPDEADKMEPIQRMLLEITWGAIEDAGYSEKTIMNSNTGVFVGRAHLSEPLYREFKDDVDMLTWTGSVTGLLSSRISYFLNLRGPSLVIDTACSSGLVALHEACKSLHNGDCEMAIAGGVSLILNPIKERKITMLESPDGQLRPFDKKSNGTVWGEGIGAVLLKPLSKAIRDKDNIQAIIKGSGINNDGASSGITAPNPDSQEKLLVDVWKKNKINPKDFVYFEAHGTGTELGDPIEIKAINNAFRKFTSDKNIVPLSTVKGNVGHLVAASGIAAVIKCTQMLKHRQIPPIVNFNEANPYINFNDSAVFINTELKEFEPKEVPAMIGINSFGISGTNVHVVLEEPKQNIPTTIERGVFLLTISVKKEKLLIDYIRNYLYFFHRETPQLANLCYTSNHRGHYKIRMTIISSSLEELKQKLEKITADGVLHNPEEGVCLAEHKIVNDGKEAPEKNKYSKSMKLEMDGQALTILEENKEITQDVLKELSALYLKGADIPFDQLYEGIEVRKISIPKYPLERRRCWIKFEEDAVEKAAQV